MATKIKAPHLAFTKRAAAKAALAVAVDAVLAKHRAKSHFMSGGNGCSCFVWVSGVCFSENSLDLSGSVEADLRAIPDTHSVHINID